MTSPTRAAPGARDTACYAAVWRWHFYAGLFVAPFLIMLCVTGLLMLLNSGLSNQLGRAPSLRATAVAAPVSAQARAAQASVGDSRLDQYVAPEAADRAAYFVFAQGDQNLAVAVDPYRAEVLGARDKNTTLYAIANAIHGELMLGDSGDRLIEIAASLCVLMVVSGWYLWWPRGASLGAALWPDRAARGRRWQRELHRTIGAWVSLFLLLFCLSGLAWAGIWGGKLVQPWSSFPADRQAANWSSDTTHASMNHGPLDEVPWALEQTPMPLSGSGAGAPGVAPPVTLDTVVQWARAQGFSGQYRVNLPRGEQGVYTIARASMSEDSVAPSAERTVHIDRYSGAVLADIGYADYSPMAKLMAQGIALHKGLAGGWNFALNVVLLLLILALCVSGLLMWWLRRPAARSLLAAPPPADLPHWKGALALMLALSLAFPLAGAAIAAVLLVDYLLIERVAVLRRVVG